MSYFNIALSVLSLSVLLSSFRFCCIMMGFCDGYILVPSSGNLKCFPERFKNAFLFVFRLSLRLYARRYSCGLADMFAG